MGPGETSQGRSLAKLVAKDGNEVIIAVRQKNNLGFFTKDKKFKVFLVDSAKKFDRLFKKEVPDVLVLCNSKSVRYYDNLSKKPLSAQTVFVSLDSNWLFLKGEEWYDFCEWLDKYFIVFSKKIFCLGLKKYGGNYYVPSKILKKIKTVGFVPSYNKIPLREKIKTRKKYKIKNDEKFIFSYFSGWGADHRHWAFDNLINSVEKLVKRGLKIKVLYVGPTDKIAPSKLQKKWLIVEGSHLSVEEFYCVLSSSDLVFQHQGLATLSQTVSAQIPTIANVMNLKDERHPRHAHAWEVGPFDKLGMCTMFYKDSPIIKISQEIEKLLYNQKEIEKMKKNQKRHYISGELNAHKEIQKLLNDKNKNRK